MCTQARTPVTFAPHGDRVVEVLRGIRVDRERRQLAEVRAPFEARLGDLVRLEPFAEPLLDEERLHHVLDPIRGADDAAHPCPAAPFRDVDEVAGPRIAQPLRSTVTGVPGTKYGSPTMSLPRLSARRSTTLRGGSVWGVAA